ncbi:hypothetical protein BDZ94DRAFT_1322506 [Collybia nuda]|uniref:DUF6533 domain-containing protein n=1 Tax=Collybia nuda TaxID=64659 RepID=A0A9P5Y390_9AGAR|nr:hypothetical protein BDZ94DRAFT_1322506 [Collybia nuda]
MDIDVVPYTQVQWERNCQLAAAVLIVYEYLIHFGDEINYFWKQRWSLVKVLFLWSRYYSTVYNIGNAVATNNPLSGLYICADADPPDEHWIAYAPTAVLIIETIFLVLALNKAWEGYRDSARGKIIPRLTNESIFYFVPIFFIHLGNQIIWMVNKITINELVTGFSFAVPAILVNRLLISIRTYNPQPNYLTGSVQTQETIRFRRLPNIRRRNSTFSDTALQDGAEVTSFGEEMEGLRVNGP